MKRVISFGNIIQGVGFSTLEERDGVIYVGSWSRTPDDAGIAVDKALLERIAWEVTPGEWRAPFVRINISELTQQRMLKEIEKTGTASIPTSAVSMCRAVLARTCATPDVPIARPLSSFSPLALFDWIAIWRDVTETES